MPWKTSSVQQARERFVRAALRGLQSIGRLCRQEGISRKTGFKWLNRFRAYGGPGLNDRSRRPRHSPTRTPARWRKAIAQVRHKHIHWGAKKIYAHLRRKHPRAHLPKVRTVTKWLARLPSAKPRRRAQNGPKLPCRPLTIPQEPNDVWTADFKGFFHTRDGRRVDPLTVRDLFSRFILGIRLLGHGHEPARQYFEVLFKRYGKPKVIRVDHGPPFAGKGALDLSRLSAWWLRLGIAVEFTRRARPQDNGAHEQMHRIYKTDVASPSAANPRAQQWRTTRWIAYYNNVRPHEALAQSVPAALYRKSRRRYQKVLRPLIYRGWISRRVTISGHVRWRGRWRVIGRAFGEQEVGFKPITPTVHQVYLGRLLIGLLVDSDPGGLRPAQWSNTPDATIPPSPMSMP